MLHPLFSDFAELGVLSVTVDRTRTLHACKHCPSVRLLRRLQFCKSGPIRLRSLDRLSFAKRGKWTADIFTQGSKRPSWPLFGHRSLLSYRHAGSHISHHCGLCECFAGGTAVNTSPFSGSRTSTSVRGSSSTTAALEFKEVNTSPHLGSRFSTSVRSSTSTALRLGGSVFGEPGKSQLLRSRMSTSVRSWVRGVQHQSDVRQVRPQLLSSRMSHQSVSWARGFQPPPDARQARHVISVKASLEAATTRRLTEFRDRAPSGWDSSATTTPPCHDSSHRDRPLQLRACPLRSPTLGRCSGRCEEVDITARTKVDFRGKGSSSCFRGPRRTTPPQLRGFEDDHLQRDLDGLSGLKTRR